MATTRHTADVTRWRIERAPVRTMSAATRTLHFLMLDRVLRRSAEREPTITNGLYLVSSQRFSMVSRSRSRNSTPSRRSDASVSANRRRNRWPATLSASSGLIFMRRASETTANSRSPISSKARLGSLASASSRASSATFSAVWVGDSKSNPTRAARFCRPSAHASAGSVAGTRSTTDSFARPLFRASWPFACSQFFSIRDGDIAEHVRVPRHHLGGDRLRHLRGVEAPLLGGDLRVHRDLEQKVAQLFFDLGVVARVDRLEELVGLLEQVGPQRLVGLLTIPRTAPWRAQSRHDLEDRAHARRERRLGRLRHRFRFSHALVTFTVRPAS